MTLKHRSEFGDDYHWKKTDTLNGCKAILLTAVNNLSLIEPFNLEPSNSGLEREALISFKKKCIEKLEELIPDLDRGNTPKGIHMVLSFEVHDLVRRLEHVELVNKVYRVLMAACGLILGILSALPLGIPLYFSPVRSYIGSFFASPKMSAQLAQTHIQTAMNQLNEVCRNEIECFHETDKNEFCFNNVSV